MISNERPDWQAYLEGREEATLFHDPRWGQMLAEVYPVRPWYITARDSRSITGCLQLIEQRSVLFGSHLCSLPYFDSAGILADTEEAREELIEAARMLRRDRRCKWVELRHEGISEEALPARTDKVTLRLDLPEDSETLWTDLKAKVRNQVRKAQKAELKSQAGGAEMVDAFHRVYARNMRDLGSPPHSLRFFQRLLSTFPQSGRIFVIRHEGQPIAASLTLRDRHAVRVPWAGADWRFRNLNANMLLYWDMLAWSADNHGRYFDFGRSTIDAGTYRFKTQWGAEPVQLVWQFLLPDGEDLPEVKPDSGAFKFLTACWTKLPLPLARWMGPRLISKLS
ncbi:MAG: FemAB family XrtA/PEP-CTERM system-associated protein [Planctomycetota bacterium]